MYLVNVKIYLSRNDIPNIYNTSVTNKTVNVTGKFMVLAIRCFSLLGTLFLSWL